MKYLNIKLLKIMIILAVISLMAVTAMAQDNTTVQATGTVLKPLEVTGTNLTFGTEIFPGINKAIAHTATGAAQFDIIGEGGKEITATFTLPSDLVEAGNETMTINFSASDAGFASTDDQSTAEAFDPSAEKTITMSGLGASYIWLGGTIEPTTGQAAGAYTADIEIQLAYTGN